MKKQSGFTLIELMVVMAIIAILATAGLSAYTGYLKKARDATRIADLQAINTIVLGAAASTGLPPADVGTLETKITDANNGTLIKDPLFDKSTCLATGAAASASASPCDYYYQTCNSGTTYRILARFESTSNNTSLYNTGSLTTGSSCTAGDAGCLYYSVGSCKTAVDAGTDTEVEAVIE